MRNYTRIYCSLHCNPADNTVCIKNQDHTRIQRSYITAYMKEKKKKKKEGIYIITF